MERFLIMSLKTLFPKKALGIGIGALWEGHFSAHQKYQQLSLNKKKHEKPLVEKKDVVLGERVGGGRQVCEGP